MCLHRPGRTVSKSGREIMEGQLARREETSRLSVRTPSAGDPRVNIQERHGMAKPSQVRQVLAAISKLDSAATSRA